MDCKAFKSGQFCHPEAVKNCFGNIQLDNTMILIYYNAVLYLGAPEINGSRVSNCQALVMNEATVLYTSWLCQEKGVSQMSKMYFGPQMMLKARVVDDRFIVVESGSSYFLNPMLVGCSEPTSRTSGSRGPSLTIFPKITEGQEGLLVIRHPKDEEDSWDATWPIRIVLKDGKPWLDLECKYVAGQWACTSEELIGSVVDSHLEVFINDKWYRSDVAQGGKDCIPDPDLICRYLVSRAKKEELLNAIPKDDELKESIIQKSDESKSKEPVTFRLDPDARVSLQRLSEAEDRTASSLINLAVREFLERK
jgi:hypothetical protein